MLHNSPSFVVCCLIQHILWLQRNVLTAKWTWSQRATWHQLWNNSRRGRYESSISLVVFPSLVHYLNISQSVTPATLSVNYCFLHSFPVPFYDGGLSAFARSCTWRLWQSRETSAYPSLVRLVLWTLECAFLHAPRYSMLMCLPLSPQTCLDVWAGLIFKLSCPVLPVTASLFVILCIPRTKTHPWLIVSTVMSSMPTSFGQTYCISLKLVTVLAILMFLLSCLYDWQLFWARSFICVPSQSWYWKLM